MKVTITVDTEDMAKGHMGFDSAKLRSDKSNPMMPESKGNFEIGHDVGGGEAYDNWSGKFVDYTVKEGDTLESIAEEFHIKPNELALLNKKEGNIISDEVNVGQKIKVPEMSDEPLL